MTRLLIVRCQVIRLKATVDVDGAAVEITPCCCREHRQSPLQQRMLGGQTATQTIAVTVRAAPIPNRAPTAVGAIDAQTVKVGCCSGYSRRCK